MDGWSNGSGHAATTEYHFFSREDYEAIKPDDFRSYRNGQSYFYISKISTIGSRLVTHSKADNMPELVKRIKIKDKKFLEAAIAASKIS